jgi:hypothetical protein
VRYPGSEVLVDRDPAPVIRLQTGLLQLQLLGHPCRPAEYMTISAGILYRLQNGDRTAACRSTDATVSPNRRSRRVPQVVLQRLDHLEIAEPSILSRRSITVTFVPSAANIEAY